MEQAANLNRVRQTESATILAFNRRDVRAPEHSPDQPGDDEKAGNPDRRPWHLNGIALGLILLPATMAVMELIRMLIAD
jgi:hypothetical protein